MSKPYPGKGESPVSKSGRFLEISRRIAKTALDAVISSTVFYGEMKSAENEARKEIRDCASQKIRELEIANLEAELSYPELRIAFVDNAVIKEHSE